MIFPQASSLALLALIRLSACSGVSDKETPAEQQPVAEGFGPPASVETGVIGYFTFASDSAHVLNEDFSEIAAKIEGVIMIGGDAGYPDVNDEFEDVMDMADE